MSDEIKWTPAQTDAINARADKILVSAAAGSGKSTVLTERIISSVLSEERNFDISKLLVVTFTRASAEDLKVKIGDALRKASSEHPENKRLSEQLIRLPSAQISTIHSLCYSIIKNNFTSLGLTASLRIGSEEEVSAIKAEIMDELLEQAYSGSFSEIPDFTTFSGNFIDNRDDKLSEIFFKIYDSVKNHPNGFEEWEKAIDSLENGNMDDTDPFAIIICQKVEMFSDHATRLCTLALEYFEADENYSKSASAVFSDNRLFLARLHELALKRDYRAIREFLPTFDGGKLGSLKSEFKTDEGEYYRQTVREYVKKELKELKEKYFCFTDGDIKYLSEKNAEISRGLLAFLRHFDALFTAEKRNCSLLDYSDLEHLALSVLYDTNGELTQTAHSISKTYTEIYVDEYQDVNPLQNKIFEALSVHAPIFMVGDIKQSIYGFRGAMPSIFADYRRSFTEIHGDGDRSCLKIFLSENFRSERTITEFANVITDALFYTPDGETLFDYRIPYSAADRLVRNQDFGKAPDVTVMIANSEKASDDEDTTAPESPEADMVAKKIYSLIKSGIEPSKIAILVRAKTLNSKLEASLRRYGIPVAAEGGSSLFDNPEIQIALCLLNCVDNPYRDIFLAGALKSPMFAFTLDDLIMIRREKNDVPLYEALCAYTYSHDFPKGRRFLSFLERMREFAVSASVDRILWQIYIETSFFSLIYDSSNVSEGEASRRRANLLKLHALAAEFTSSGKNDLYSFTERLRTFNESQTPPAGASDEGSGIKIVTIHHSKGLEYEHCFLCGLGKKINKTDLSKPLIYDHKYGVALRVKDELRLSSSDSPQRLALAHILELSQLDEEMRVLYVALTRAKTALYICAEDKKFDELELNCRMSASFHHPMTFLTQNRFIEWILTALRLKTELAPRYKTEIYTESDLALEYVEAGISDDIPVSKQNTAKEKELYDILSKRLSFKYPHEHSALLPSKLAVSKLYPGVLDNDEVIPEFDGSDLPFIMTDDEDIPNSESSLKVPSFIQASESVSGAEKGTATHVFMQFCDFNLLEENGVDAEIKRLCDARFITNEMADLVNKKQVKGFLSSDIYLQLKFSPYIQREYRFNIKLPASDFTNDAKLKEELSSDDIFVQGVIDCYFSTADGQTILLDYKTDHVPNDILGDTTAEDEFFRARYERQLSYYETALKRLTGRDVDEVLIYSFVLGRSIKL